MIDVETESLLSLTAAAKHYPFPCRRAGKRPNVSTLYRWSLAGCRGVRLETVQVGGTRCTSREALGRFFARLSQRAGLAVDEPMVRSPAARRRAMENAIRDLESAGA